MRTYQDRAFAHRVKRIERRYSRAQRRRQGVRSNWGLSTLLTALGLAIALKALIFANVPEGRYVAKVQMLQAGSEAEMVVGWLLQPDPLTGMLAGYLKLP